MRIIQGDKTIAKAWVDGVDLEQEAEQQIINLTHLPFVQPYVAVMPDAHAGCGSTIGSVIPTSKAIIPAAVGVDIGCGMCAIQTQLKTEDLPDDLKAMRIAIESAVPHGRTDHGGRNDKGAWQNQIPLLAQNKWADLEAEHKRIIGIHPKINHDRAYGQLGTLGTGNHFIEICLDENKNVWIMLHSGSRGQGNRIGTYFIEKAKREMERWMIHLPDSDLAYLPEGSEFFKDYIDAVHWAQQYAFYNREIMMSQTINAIELVLGRKIEIYKEAINCHHNYVQKENHQGQNLWITRKGAVSARKGELGIIPGSMGAKSFIVRGKGNTESFTSCSHGAGRKMSRTKARNTFSVEEHEAATKGVECRKDISVIDETPAAYKDIDAVMKAQEDLVEIVHTLKQVICVKG